MEKIKFFNSEKTLLESDIIHIENRLGIKFPTDFKAHYLLYNGGEPEKNVWVDIKHKFKNIEIDNFISLLYNKDFMILLFLNLKELLKNGKRKKYLKH